jgi:biopolymer transport protein ExbD
MRLKRRKQKREYRVRPLPLVSLIDVTMCLLMYFMIAGSLVAEESELSSTLRTQAGAAGAAQDLQAQLLLVEMADGKPRFRIGEWVANDREKLTGILARLPKQAGVIVRVSGDVPIEAAASALQASKDAGFSKVSYVPGS